MFRNVFCIVVAIVWTTLLFPVIAAVVLFPPGGATAGWVMRRWWSPVLLWAGGATLEVHGLEHVDLSKPRIFVSNHQSTIDVPVLFMALPANFRFVAKKSLKYVPFLGWGMMLSRFVFIDRSNHRAAVTSLDLAAKRIQGGTSLAMFPEGTRSADCRVMPFKKGPFALAMKAGVAIHPVTIEGSGRLMPKNSWNITPGPIRVLVGEAIDPALAGENREALAKLVRDVVIDQSVALGGLGGDKSLSVARLEGVGRRGEAEGTA